MKNKQIPLWVFFCTRLILYLFAFAIPIFHPAISVPYDSQGWVFWFIVIPGEMFIAYFLSPPKIKFIYWIGIGIAFSAILVISFIGISLDSMFFIFGGILSFIFTALIFKTKGKGRLIAGFEIFFLGIIYYVLLGWFRASEEIADVGAGLTQILLVLSISTFLLHAMVLYLASFRQSIHNKAGKEIFLFIGLSIPIIILIGFLLPGDFIKHSIEFNPIKEDVEPDLIPVEPGGNPLVDDGNIMSDGNKEGDLRGIKSDKWGSSMGEGKGSGQGGKQYAVMIVAGSMDPIYAADAYFSDLDPERGFEFSRELDLNNLSYLHIIETWKSKEQNKDIRRKDVNIFYLSTISKRVLAYMPYSIEPTILNPSFYPFSYSYSTVSKMNSSSISEWRLLRDLYKYEKEEYKEYLDIPFSNETIDKFMPFLQTALEGEIGYYEKIDSILKAFSGHQYELGYTDDVSVENMQKFLNTTKTGDCTEFSNTFAILARLAGIPSRVVTGYLATKNLQTRSHKRGVLLLRSKIDLLKQFSLEELFLVTTSHRHSWTQLYVPDFGWIDFEPTQYAIPPPWEFNPNSMDVVIPIIEARPYKPEVEIPWSLVGYTFVLVLLISFVSLYIFRYGKEAVLILRAGKEDDTGLRSLYRVMLMKLAAGGYNINPPYKTPLEYSEIYPEFKDFASIYTELKYRSFIDEDEKRISWMKLRKEYLEMLKYGSRPGPINFIKRVFSLRGLGY